jgi:hypothetical protein
MSTKQTGEEQVAEYLSRLQHPFKAEIEEVRRIILASVPELTEHIKWNAPSFCHDNEDRITMQLQGKGFFRLIFHTGAKKSGIEMNKERLGDSIHFLEWAAPDRATVKLSEMSDINSKRDKLKAAIVGWIDATA